MNFASPKLRALDQPAVNRLRMKHFYCGLITTILVAMLATQTTIVQSKEVAVGAYSIPGSPGERLFLEYAKRIEKRSGGQLEVNLLIHGQGGSEEQLLPSLRRGRIHIASISTMVISSLIPEIGMLGAPYLFDSLDEFDHTLNSNLLSLFQEFLSEKNLTILRWMELGGQTLYGKKPLLWPKDAKGYRIRATQDPAARFFLEAVEADVIYVASPDAIPALQTGLLDGGMTPTIAYANTGLVSEAPHLTLTHHFFVGTFLLANRIWLESLSTDLRYIVEGSFATNRVISQTIRQMVADSFIRAEDEGFTAHRLNSVQKKAWKMATGHTHAMLIATIGGRAQEVYNAMKIGKRTYQETRK